MQNTIDRRSRGMLDGAMDQLRLPTRLRQTVTMDCRDRAIADVEGGVMSVELDTQIFFPKIPAPAVMVSAYHYNGHSAAKPGQQIGRASCRESMDSYVA